MAPGQLGTRAFVPPGHLSPGICLPGQLSPGLASEHLYLWDRSLNDENIISSWSNEVKSTFYSCGLNAIFDNNKSFQLELVIDTIKEKFISD